MNPRHRPAPWACCQGLVLITLLGAPGIRLTEAGVPPPILQAEAFRHYIEGFNRTDQELYRQQIPNAEAWAFLRNNIPLLECPDPDIERTYYFRWWTFRKHLKKTPDGYVITEFLPPVGWAGKYNTINCAAGHHFYEGRWLHDPVYLNDYARFWFRHGGGVRSYSFWAADALWATFLVHGNPAPCWELFPDLLNNYEEWEKTHLDPDGLFWQIDDRDGMEVSIGGSGRRPTINAYLYGDALALARIAARAGRPELEKVFREKADRLKALVQSKLWDPQAQFFKTLPRNADTLVEVRELHGYTPWYFNLPDPGYETAWSQLLDPAGFAAPFGPTTAEQRHPGFRLSYEGHECQWNGPSWPFATAVTLTALANLLNNYAQDTVTPADYFDLLKQYAQSQQLKREDGLTVPWIDENLNPRTGDWIARTRLKTWKGGTWDPDKGGVERGKDYNHSTFCDLVISGLIGLRPRADEVVEVHPLVPPNTWDWFCLDRVRYHGRILTILWDRTGAKYGGGQGLRVLADGRQIAHADSLRRVEGTLPPAATGASADWQKHAANPVFAADPSRPWEQHKVTACQVLPLGDWHLMFYIGFRNENLAQIGLARSRDGIQGWERHPANPILFPTPEAWDGDACYKPFALFDAEQDRWLLWYNGRKGNAEQIGMAVHPGRDLGFSSP